MKTRLLRRRGANAIEFAMTVPLLIGLVGGVFDYALYFHARSNLYQAALEGVRVASMVPIDEAVATANEAFRASLADVNLGDAEVDVEPELVLVNGEDAIRLDVSMEYQGIAGLATLALPENIELSLVMRLEEQ